MAEEKTHSSEKTAQTGTTLFRLPRFFTQAAEATEENSALDENAQGLEVGATESSSMTPPNPAPNALANELSSIREELERLSDQITQVNERESSLERVFDALHAELAEYKNDFLYEHLKPVVRPLLFLFDSLEQFDSEVAMTESGPSTAADHVLSKHNVLNNVGYFRDQLVEALRVCEVTIMETPQGPFNAKFHKAIDIVPVPAEQDNTIVRVVRSGWYLNGQLLRPAEVVVGKYRG